MGPDPITSKSSPTTSERIRLVTVTLELDGGDTVYVYVEDDATPAVLVAAVAFTPANEAAYHALSFIVPADWYYEVHDQGGSPTILEWHEWDLH